MIGCYNKVCLKIILEFIISKKVTLSTNHAPAQLQGERHQALSELEKYKMLVENVQDYAIFFMDANGYIQTWNKGAQKNKGYTHDEIIGQHFSIFYSEVDKIARKPQIELEIAKKLGRVEDEDWRIKKDGSRFWANVVITALYDDSGELQGFAKVTRNLTERKENEDSLRSANLLLHQQQKELQSLNESKDDFISLASHQLRTPATAIKQLLGVLIEGLAGDVPQHILDILKKAYESNERQIAIVNSLLKVAQIDSGKIVLRKQLIDLNKIISSIADQYVGVVSDKNQSIILSLNDKPVYGCVDEGYYRMILENILDNASKYTSEGGLITVASYVENNFAVVTVADNGVGIKPENISTLFDKFNRIPNDMAHKVAGSGLGLYWVEKVVDLHQGKIEVESEINGGTKFLISVPREL